MRVRFALILITTQLIGNPGRGAQDRIRVPGYLDSLLQYVAHARKVGPGDLRLRLRTLMLPGQLLLAPQPVKHRLAVQVTHGYRVGQPRRRVILDETSTTWRQVTVTLAMIEDQDIPDMSAWSEEDHYRYASEVAQHVRRVDEGAQWFYGRVADSLETQYGDNPLAKLAKAIGKATNTVEHYRRTYLAWKVAPDVIQKQDLGPVLPQNYSTAYVLAAQPDRHELLAANPGMNKAEASRIVRKRQLPPSPTPDSATSQPENGLSRKARERLTAERIRQLTDGVRWFAGWPPADCARLLAELQEPLMLLQLRAAERET